MPPLAPASVAAPGRAPDHVDCLDGLRGLAATWVLVGHALLLTGWRLPVLGQPDLPVDLFVMLSGFLMTFHYERRRAVEPWERPGTWGTFWVRRFFRIAPLYYVALVVALLLAPWLGAWREAIHAVIPRAGTEPARYADQGAANVLAHLSFLFGLSPRYAYRTPLPDWSIGLEMQFYAVFPGLMLLWRSGRTRARVLWSAALVGACAALALGTSVLGAFPMPAFLPAKLALFLAGMLIAAALRAPGGSRGPAVRALAAAALVAAVVPTWRHADVLHVGTRLAFVVTLLVLPRAARLPAGHRLAGPAAVLNRALASPPLRWLGDVSYGVYLLHLLVLIPVAGWLAQTYGPAFPAGARFALALAGTAVVVYPLAWVTFRGVEQPGVRWGKAWLARRDHVRAATFIGDRSAA